MTMPVKFNQYYLLSGLCALISLLPVLNYSLAVPGEMALTLIAWFLSNVAVSVALFFYSRFGRAANAHA